MAAVRRKLWVSAGVGSRCELHCGGAVQVIEPELSLRIKYQMLRILSPQVGCYVVTGKALFFPLVGDFVVLGRPGRPLGGAAHHSLLACARIHLPKLPFFAVTIPLYE